MKNNTSNLTIALTGFVAGILFLVSCGGGSSNSAEAVQVTPATVNDQMSAVLNLA